MNRPLFLTTLLAICLASSLPAQWQTQRFPVKEGWNAIYPFVDASDRRLIEIVDARIEAIWRWNPNTLDGVALTAAPTPVVGGEWAHWTRGVPGDSDFFDRLLPNFAYLVKVKDGTTAFPLAIKGKVVMPRVRWRNDGLNLVGFPGTGKDGSTIGAYLSPTGLIDDQTDIFRYIGGPLTSSPVNLKNPVLQSLPRGEAFWINTGKFSDYSGPVQVEVSLSAEGLHFGEVGTGLQLVLRNRTARDLTVTLTPDDSENDSMGKSLSPVPLLQRVFDAGAQVFTYPALNSPLQIELPAGGTAAPLLYVDRAGLTGSTGTLNASLLRVTDSEGLSRIDVPVSAIVTDQGGLWLGEAVITRVQNQLQQFQREADGTYKYDEDGNRIPLAGTGDSELHATAQSYSFRLIVHVDEPGQARLLSAVYAGPIATPVPDAVPELGIATSESLLEPGSLAKSVRITSAHFPLDMNHNLEGTFGSGGTLEGTVTLAYDDKDNPFVHSFHPDHDNLDARFKSRLRAGDESHTVTRKLSFVFDNASPDSNPAWGSRILTGTYSEEFTAGSLHKKPITVEGSFSLRRLSRSKTLHTP